MCLLIKFYIGGDRLLYIIIKKLIDYVDFVLIISLYMYE